MGDLFRTRLPGDQAGVSRPFRRSAQALRVCIVGAVVATTFTACDSGDGGDNGGVGQPDNGAAVGAIDANAPAGLAFSYPIDGQTDVYPGTTIVFAFSGEAEGDVALIDTESGQALPAAVVAQGNGIYNIRPADSDARMAPATTYAVVARGRIGDDDNTAFEDGDSLFAFTTAPAIGASVADDFTLVNFPSGSDAGFPIAGTALPFTQFNTVRARFSQAVDVSHVKLCRGTETLGQGGCSVAVTGADGRNVAGRLNVAGRDLVFDPGTIAPDPANQNADQYANDDLAADTRYSVNFGDEFVSTSGAALSGTASFSIRPLAINTGDRVDVVQRLRIGNIGDDDDDTSPVTGRTANNIELASQLIGRYDLAAVPSPEQGGLQVRLAAFNGPRFSGTIPTLLPRGQKFLLKDFNLGLGSRLGDDGTFDEAVVDTPVDLDGLQIQFANDSDIYLLANDLSNIGSPARVTQRLDLNIFGQVAPNSPIAALANGVVNQTALNILASGVAVPQENGDISLVLYGSFPISVNADGRAAVNFELELTLPASADDQPQIMADMTNPRITAQYPSACTYTFNVADTDNEQLFESGDIVGGLTGTTTLSATEANCISVLNERRVVSAGEQETDFLDDFDPDATYNATRPVADSLPLGASPSLLFSEPVDPASLAGNVTLVAGENSSPVTVRMHAEGASVVIDPVRRLAPDTTYTLRVNSRVTDMSGNRVALAGDFPDSAIVSSVQFTTEPMVIPFDEAGDPVAVSDDVNEAVFQTAPFVTAISVGLACPLIPESGDYLDGGDVAGRCVGDTPSEQAVTIPAFVPFFPVAVEQAASPARPYDVFSQPANAPIEVYFSKPVQKATISLADGCLSGGSGNDNADATIAIQRMDGSGNCEQAVPGQLSTLGNGALTTGFAFQPARPFEPGARYWVVICGSSSGDDDGQENGCTSGRTIMGQSGLALNTDPLTGTGTRRDGQANQPGLNTDDVPGCGDDVPGTVVVSCFVSNEEAGGPDIRMPFNGVPATPDYATIVRALPKTDTNGNGFLDNTPTAESQIEDPTAKVISGVNSGNDRGPSTTVFNDAYGRERVQVANAVYARTLNSFAQFGFGSEVAPAEAGFLGGERPIILGQALSGSDCNVNNIRLENDTPVVSNGSPNSCIPIDLPPGGFLTLTSLPALGATPTGRLLLRFPNRVVDGQVTGQPQRGYIVPKCSGTFPASGEVESFDYDYSPCFVADLQLTLNAPDTVFSDGQGLGIEQQDISLQVFGPVAFEQDGRLVIATRNTRAFAITAKLGFFNSTGPLEAPIPAGYQTLQLVGPALHGGLAFPQ